MQLSKRLMMTAGCVTKGYRTADVGCDHAYLSIYLVTSGIVPWAAAMDVNKGPLKMAEENVIKYKAADRVELRLSDGLDNLKPSEADAIVIAGMGGELMVSIMRRGMECVAAAKELILQPQSEPYKVRRFLMEAGYHIIYEDMCIDASKYYTVIKAVNINTGQISYTEDTYSKLMAEEVYGGYLLEHRNEVLKEYLQKELDLNHRIQTGLNENPTDKAAARLLECREEEERIKNALLYY